MFNFDGIGSLARIEAHSYKRLRYGWCVFNVRTGQVVITGIPTRIRAMYVAARYMGHSDNYFYFGDALHYGE